MSEEHNFEGDVYFPSDAVLNNANIQDPEVWYQRAMDNLEAFWGGKGRGVGLV